MMKFPSFSNLVAMVAGLRRFPLPILAAIIATAASIVAIHSSRTLLEEQSVRILLTMLFGLPLLVGGTYGSEIHPKFRWALRLGSLLAMGGVFFLLPEGMHASSMWFRFWTLTLAAFAAASMVPGLVREGSFNWWRVNVGWLNALVLAAIMTTIVEIGLHLALVSVRILFGLEVRYGTLIGHLHADLFAIAGCLIGPITALALFPLAKGELHAEQPGFKVWANLCRWALIPIGFLFMAILAAYALKIVIQWKLPNGMVATPVLSLGAYGTLAMLLIQPWRNERSWARWFALIYPPAFLLSSILLFISLVLRIREYGVTFDRYSALAAGIWLTASALCFLTRHKQAPVLVSSLLVLIALVAALGPMSAGTLSLHSQSERLKHLLASKDRNEEQIRSIVRMIVQDFGLTDLEKVTGSLGLNSKLDTWQLIDQALKKLQIAKEERSSGSYELGEGTSVPISGCIAYLQAPSDGWNNSVPSILGKNAAGEELSLNTGTQGDLKLILHAGCREIASKKIDELDFESARKNKAPVSFTLDGEGRSFLILITNARWNSSSKQRKIYAIQYQVFEKQPVPVKEEKQGALRAP